MALKRNQSKECFQKLRNYLNSNYTARFTAESQSTGEFNCQISLNGQSLGEVECTTIIVSRDKVDNSYCLIKSTGDYHNIIDSNGKKLQQFINYLKGM